MTLRVGKHKGKSFSEVASSDRGYCSWVLRLGSSANVGNLDKFSKHIKKNFGGVLAVGLAAPKPTLLNAFR